MMQGCSTSAVVSPNYSPQPSEYMLTPGKAPPLPMSGTPAEMSRVYLQTVGLYRISEDKRAALAEFLRKKPDSEE